MEQAPALVDLIDEIRTSREWIVTSYTGYRIESLRTGIRPGTKAFVDRLDLLIDGPYLVEHHAPLLWRGSTNQRIHQLSGRVDLPADEPAGVMPFVDPDGSFDLIGVYPEPDFLNRFMREISQSASTVSPASRRPQLPFPIIQEP